MRIKDIDPIKVIIIGMLVSASTNIWYDFSGDVSIYFKGTFFMFLCTAIAAFLWKNCLITRIFLLLTTAQLIDEFTNNPYSAHFMEYIIVSIYIFYEVAKERIRAKLKTNDNI
jgi:hypothetical protein